MSTIDRLQECEKARLAPYEIRHDFYYMPETLVQLERHEILHFLRGKLEDRHRSTLGSRLTYPLWIGGLSRLQHYMPLHCWNKTVPIYLLRSGAGQREMPAMLMPVLHSYLYRLWFRPYRSEIEYDQFIARMFYVEDQPESLDEASGVKLALSMHDAVCYGLDNTKPDARGSEYLQFYKVPALFRAMAIVVPGQNYNNCHVISRVAHMPVLIVLTGNEGGLSAPITFDSIKEKINVEIRMLHGKTVVRTNLETAVSFVMDLEKREEAAFGPQPDPVASTADLSPEHPFYFWELRDARKLGWGDEPLKGPSSQWVDMDRYPEWTGAGARFDVGGTVAWDERRAYECHAKYCNCSEQEGMEALW